MKKQNETTQKEKNEKKQLKKREQAEKKQHKYNGISLRSFVTFLIIVLCAGIMIAYSFLSGRLYIKRYQEQMENNVISQSEYVKNLLKENNMSLTEPENLDLRIEGLATSVYGRVLIINGDYRIVKDTYGNRNNAIIVNEDVIAVMRGQAADRMTTRDGYVEYMTAIEGEEGNQGVLIIQASIEGIETIEQRVEQRNILSFSLIMLVCVVAAWAIGNASSRGIKRINRQMDAAGDGQLEAKLDVRGFKEFKQLTERYNSTISKLKVIDSTRQEFVSNVSHELKTPITSMKVLADSLIQNENADLDMYKEFMSDIVDEIDRESKIINDLLTLVKMDKKSAEMNLEEISINDLLEVILKRVTPIARSRGIEITYESYRDVVATVDEVKLSLALTNIIENAVKYNVDNGWVKVTLNADHKNFYVKVADSGVGIPDDCKEQVFERFYRVDKARSRDTGGTGLGLAITKSVILMHKGTIKLYSESGEGTTFTIKIPMKAEGGEKA
ncbi:MAG: sensor histidine kinase [Wujia sp.]